MSDTYQPETTPGAADPPLSAASELKRTAGEAKDAAIADVREGVARGTAKVQEAAAARSEAAKVGLAHEVSATADALGAAARELEGQSLQRSLLQEASDGLASISQALEGRSVGDIVSDLSAFGRRNPAALLGGAALAGFALARLAQASASGVGTPPRDSTIRRGVDASADPFPTAAPSSSADSSIGAGSSVSPDPLARGAF